MKDWTDNAVSKATDIPYFEGDFWTSTIEDLIKEMDMEEDRRRFEELEAVKACDDDGFDDSIETEEPTEVRSSRRSDRIDRSGMSCSRRTNANQARERRTRRKTSRKQRANVA